MSHTIQSLYRNILLRLKTIYFAEEAKAIADRVIEHFFYHTPVQRAISGNLPVSDLQVQDVEIAVGRLMQNEPLQYVLGTAWFMDMEFDVSPAVLIPRPETEELVSLILKWYKDTKPGIPLRVLDIGTGSGCIAVAIKRNIPGACVTALDISEGALSVAKSNADKLNADVEFLQCDILGEQHWHDHRYYDVIVSNPPYVTRSEEHKMLSNVLNFEPHAALFVPDNDPLLFYRAIIRFAKNRLHDHGTLWFEINESYGEDLKQLTLDHGFKDVNIIFDFQGKSRFLQCHSTNSPF